MPRLGQAGERLQEQRRLADAGLATEQRDRARHEAPLEHAVELADDQGLIRQFVRRGEDEVVLHQFNPPKDLKLKPAEVKRIYRITGSAEAG